MLESLITEAQASGNFPEAVRYQRLRNESEPHNEEMIERLMDLLIHYGEENAARDVYHTYTRSLGKHINPGHTLQKKFATLHFAASQLPSNWTPPLFAQLPGALPDIIGRDRVLLEVQALLDRVRFVTLKGTPGVGKTLLALHLASRVSITFNHNVVFVDLTEARDLADAERRILACLGVPSHPSLPLPERIRNTIGQERLLMVLDNCECVVANSEPFIRNLLISAPRLKVITTSHIPWRSLSGEHVVHVRPLTIPPPRLLKLSPERLTEALPRFEAVNLYLAEVANIQPTIQLIPENAHAIAKLVSLLEGLPLAIKLAAGTSHTLSPEQTLDHLEKKDYEILKDRMQTLPHKHQSVNAALDIAYKLLSYRLQTLFVSLAVFRGGWTKEAVEAICGDNMAEEVLIQLQERSLITAAPMNGVMRFSMLDTVHCFVSDILTKSQQFRPVSKRHADYYRTLALKADPHLTGQDQADWLRRLRLEADNFTAALIWCLESQHITLGLQLANAYWRLWYMNSDYDEGFHYLHTLLEAASPEMDPLVRLKALGAAGIFAMQRTDYSKSRHYFLSAIQLAENLNRPLARASACANLGNVESFDGNYPEAERLQWEAVGLYKEVKDERNTAICLGNLASIATRKQDPQKAIEYGSQAADAFRAIGDIYNLAVAQENLSEAYLQERRELDALSALSEALNLSSELGAWRIVSECHVLLLLLATARKNWNTAANLIGMHRTLHHERELPLTSPDLPSFHALREQTEAAIGPQAYQEAIRNASQLEQEQCVIAMQAVCANMKDTLMSERFAVT